MLKWNLVPSSEERNTCGGNQCPDIMFCSPNPAQEKMFQSCQRIYRIFQKGLYISENDKNPNT